MRTRAYSLLAAGLLLPVSWLFAQPAAAPQAAKSPQEILGAAVMKWAAAIEPGPEAAPRTLATTVKVLEAQGPLQALAGRQVELAFQAPDKLRVSAQVEGRALTLGRDGNELWIYAPTKNFGVIGTPGVPRFATAPDRLDGARLDPIKLPVAKDQLMLLPLMLQVEALPEESVGGAACQVLKATPQAQAIEAFKVPSFEVRVWIRPSDSLPARIAVDDRKGLKLTLEFAGLTLGEPWAPDRWKLAPAAGDKVEKVALSHVKRFIPAALSLLDQRIPVLGPETGQRKVLASEGKGWLEDYDGTKVLFLQGSPEEMGRQHGVLMRRQVRDLVDKVLYGVGVGSSFDKGRWFFGEIEEAQRRLLPFMDPRYVQEMDAMALAANLDKEEVRLSNYFPELFHCSGFAIYGSATVEGRMYHGRILDYMKGVGLEPNAVVTVFRPDYGNAWVNIGYAGLAGSVTAMNEKHISIGEMGGRGEGQWDGKPMAQLLREVMEKAGTLDEAVEIMRRGPRTCEYYYVIADGNAKRAVGVAATPTTFELIQPGQSHPRLPHAVKDAVLMSAGDRYEKLAERVMSQHGKLDAEGARHLMDRPVCMTSNIHSALFAPDSLDFWVANADAKNVASHCRYTHYNLAELLKTPRPGTVAAAGSAGL